MWLQERPHRVFQEKSMSLDYKFEGYLLVHCIRYNTPQLLDQKVSDAKLIFCAVLSSILV